MINAFTVDVEDYFQVEAFKDCISRESWESRECRVEANTRRILELLAEQKVRGTFFILGWVAERYPQLIRDIASDGHEIASHGYDHKLIYTQQRAEFAEETDRTKKILEDLIGEKISGYRAATYSITGRSLWALDVLVEQGFRYDSSIFPGHHDKYGIPENRIDPYLHRTPGGQDLVEFPVSILPLGPLRLPVAGGGYFRLFPYRFSRWAFNRINRRVKQPFMFYIHPWEVDTGQPRIADARRTSRFRHYVNLESCEQGISNLLKDFEFRPMVEVLTQMELLR